MYCSSAANSLDIDFWWAAGPSDCVSGDPKDPNVSVWVQDRLSKAFEGNEMSGDEFVWIHLGLVGQILHPFEPSVGMC